MQEFREVSHEERLERGKLLSEKILERYGEHVLAICLYGSTAKSLDRPYSDTEVLVVLTDDMPEETRYYIYRGSITEIDYVPESKMLKGASKVSPNWPMEADQYRNRIVLFERNHWFEKLQLSVREGDSSDAKDATRRAAVGLTESLCSVLNSRYSKNNRGIKIGGIHFAEGAANLLLLLNKTYVITTGKFWEQAFACKVRPADFDSLIDASCGFGDASPDSILSACQELYSRMIALVESQGISVETESLVV
jgi:predicted nucleotidyltransferase